MKTRLLSLSVTAAFLSSFLYPVVSGCARTGSGSPGLSEPAVQKEGAGGIEKNPYLGLKVAEFRATGFFRLEKLGEPWILVKPEGHPFYRIGINGITPWYGNYPAVDSQRARGENYGKIAQAGIKIPYLISYSWHEYVDPSEDMNLGLIDKNDRVYEEPVSLISQENRKIEARFAKIVRSLGGGKKSNSASFIRIRVASLLRR